MAVQVSREKKENTYFHFTDKIPCVFPLTLILCKVGRRAIHYFSCTYRLDRLYEEVLDAERVGSKQDLLTNMENEQIETDACFGTLIRNE